MKWILEQIPWKYPSPIQSCQRGGLKNGIIKNENEHHQEPDRVPSREEETILGGFQLFRKNITHFFQTFNRKKWYGKLQLTLGLSNKCMKKNIFLTKHPG